LPENLFERPSKFNVEYRVDDRVEETVDVAEPDEEREQDLLKMTYATVFEEVVSNAHGVDDVDCEERNPTKHENTCNRQRWRPATGQRHVRAALVYSAHVGLLYELN